MYLRVSKDLPLAVFASPLALLLFLERLPDLRGYALDKPPELFVFLFQHEDFHLFLYALFVVDLLFQALVLLRQIVDGGLILLHLPQVPFQPGEVRPHHLQNLVPLLPGVQHPDFRNCLLSDIRPPEIELELEKEIEIKREIEKGRPETGRTARVYGRYQNVFLTDEELADLQASFPTVWNQYIEKLSEYMASTGKRYQSHAATIRRWASEDARKAAPPSRNRDYSVKEDETV